MRRSLLLGALVSLLACVAACNDEASGGNAGASGAAGTTGTAGGSGASGSQSTGGSAGSAGAAGGIAGGAGSAGAAGQTTGGAAGVAGQGGAGGAPPTCKDPKEIPAFTSEPLHLTKVCSPYHVAVESVVASGQFTIDAGVTITFAPSASLRVEAGPAGGTAIVANGTDADPISFVPDAPMAAKGSWGGITLGNATGVSSTFELHGVRIAGAGAAADGTTPPVAALAVHQPALLDRVTVDGSKGFGMSVLAPLLTGSQSLAFADVDEWLIELPFPLVASLPAITSKSGNAKAMIGVGTGVSATGTWLSQPVPFVLSADQTIGDGATGESTVVTIQKNTLLFAAGAGLTIGATEGQMGTGDLVANDVTFDALDPNKPWGGLMFVARYTGVTAVIGGRVSRGFAQQPFTINIPMTMPTAYARHYAGVFVGESAATHGWAKLQGVTIADIGAIPPPPPMSNDVSVATCIAVRGIPCDKPAPHYDMGANTLNCAEPVLDYDSCVGP